MDIKTLESLGINPEELGNRIVDQAVETMLSSTGFDPENEVEVEYESRFKKEIERRLQQAVDAKISALADKHLIPRVGELIESANMQKTNGYGEKISPPMTFKEYIAHRADAYMSETVDCFGKSKADLEAQSESTYNWRASGPRLTVLMKIYIRETLEKAAKEAISDINKVIAEGIKKEAVRAIASAAENLKVSVSA